VKALRLPVMMALFLLPNPVWASGAPEKASASKEISAPVAGTPEGLPQDAIKGTARFKKVPINPRHAKTLCRSIERSKIIGLDAVAKEY
jgi:hypothetical protein